MQRHMPTKDIPAKHCGASDKHVPLLAQGRARAGRTRPMVVVKKEKMDRAANYSRWALGAATPCKRETP